VYAFLLVEDAEDIAIAFRVAIEEAYIPVIVYRVSDGEQAVEYLRAADQRPDVVFLDLNMPKVSGWEVLREMKADESLRPIPVVIFSTSSRRADKERAYALGAQQFFTKPATFAELVAEIEAVYYRFVGNANSAASGGA
jgi:CheY-like chemotaxis protein